MIESLPRVGAAMPVGELHDHIDWLVSGQRDLEIQDPMFTPIYDGDWSHLDVIEGFSARFGRAHWRDIVREARAVLDGHEGRLSIHGPFMGIPLATVDRKIRDVVRERLKQALAFAQALGATQMVLHSPWMFFGGPYVPYARAKDREMIGGLVADLLADVLPVAQQANCTLLLEGVRDKHPDPLLSLIRSLASDYVRMSLDVGHAYITHSEGGPPPDYWVQRAGSLLAHVHLQDGDGQADRHWAPGRGNVNWYAFFEALQALEEMPRLILEARDLRQGAAWLARKGYVC